MASTPKLGTLTALADYLDWRVVLVGDPLQFSAVGRGGMFRHMLDHAPDGAAIEHLEHVHRFAADWEADVVMLAATNESVAELNRAAQRLRVAAGELVQPIRSVRLIDGSSLCLGDEVQTRQNDRSLTTDEGITVKNRHRWTVEEINDDGSVTVSDDERGQVTLPRDYVANCLDLAYASTAMAAQGRTVDDSLLLVDGPIDSAGLYVPMTRGRLSNDVWVITDGIAIADPVDLLADVMQQRWVDRPAIEHLENLSVTESGGIDL